MTASVKLFDNSVAIFSAEATKQSGYYEYRLSGVIDAALTLDDLDTAYTSWVAVTSRLDSVTVLVDYGGGVFNTYTVEPGLPLLVQTRASQASPDVTVTPVNNEADIELYVFTGSTELSPADPAYLILDASTGITEDDFLDGSVTDWRDTRAVSLAPDNFSWGDSSTTEPVLIESDPDFGGRPSVDFSEAGSSFYNYSGLSTEVSWFGEAGESWTLLLTCSFPDDAVDNTDYQGILNTGGSASTRGFGALIDPAYRLKTEFYNKSFVDSSGGLIPEEFAPKSTVIVLRYDWDTEELRAYFQGKWRLIDFTPSAGTPGNMDIGMAYVSAAATTSKYFRGKIANLTLYREAVDVSVINAYIANAVANYGIDDTEVQGFPYIADAVAMHRANRGFASNSATSYLWYDTRPEVTLSNETYFMTTTAGQDSPQAADDILNGQLALIFDGTVNKANLAFSGTEDDFLTGDSPGFTVAMIGYRSGHDTVDALLTMSSYDNALLNGIGIYGLGSAVRYELDNAANDDVVKYSSTNLAAPYTPRLIIFRVDGSNYYITEVNLETEEVFNAQGAFGGTPSATTAAGTLYLAVDGDNASYLADLVVAEVTLLDANLTATQLAQLKAYALARYGT